MKNFYTGFDYNNDEILIGVNKGSYSAEIFGFSPNPKDIKSTNSNYILIIVSILILFGGGILIYIK